MSGSVHDEGPEDGKRATEKVKLMVIGEVGGASWEISVLQIKNKSFK